jgi:hypothetical protein
MTEITNELDLLGDRLQRAWRADHRKRAATTRRRRRITIILAAVVLLLAAGAAIASSVLKSSRAEEQGLLKGHLLFKGTQPSCEQLTPTSFLCSLDKPPTGMTFYAQDGKRLTDAFLGVKTATVDENRHVDGGCVATSADGRRWHCYLGEEAVRQDIISADFLGAYLPETPTG